MQKFRCVAVVLLLVCVLLHAPSESARAHFEPKIGRYESIPWGFSTNTWWIEGPEGVILVNTQFLPSAIQEAQQTAEEYTGKSVVLALVLHPNPDKFNGTAYLRSQGIRVLTSAQVLALIPEVDRVRREWFYQRYAPDYPEKLVLPEAFGDATTTLHVAGLEVRLHVMGRAASNAHVVAQVGPHVFAGDVLANGHHAWLELGQVSDWLTMLEGIEALGGRYFYPGRGAAGGAPLLQRQRDYLRFFRAAVRDELDAETLSDAAFDRIQTRLIQRHPKLQNSFFIERGIRAVWNVEKALSAPQ